ncbi:MAG: hypothetical protein L0Y44_07725 [Phycisphaerales bacterium]|nr:hypothetical protein [Phycisphaerales bacterium]
MAINLPNRRIVSGADEINRFIGQLADSSATHLQNVFRKNAFDHREGVVKSSTFKVLRASSLRRLVMAWPKKASSASSRKRLRDVRAGVDVYWRGLDAKSPAEGVAARIEKRIGQRINRPLRKRFLLIPLGDMRTPSGQPRRVGQGGTLQGVPVRALPGAPMNQNRRVGGRKVPLLQAGVLANTAVIKNRRGRLLLIQNIGAGNKGLHENFNRTDGVRRLTKRNVGQRSRILAVLKRSAKQAQPLDFFGSWDRLRGAREARYGRMLDQIVAGKRAAA